LLAAHLEPARAMRVAGSAALALNGRSYSIVGILTPYRNPFGNVDLYVPHQFSSTLPRRFPMLTPVVHLGDETDIVPRAKSQSARESGAPDAPLVSSFRANEVRLQLSVLGYNLGNLWRRLVLPKRVDRWSLTSMQQRLVKTGGRLGTYRYFWHLLAESHLTRRLFGSMLQRILALPADDRLTRQRCQRPGAKRGRKEAEVSVRISERRAARHDSVRQAGLSMRDPCGEES
jgi:hypothetical protein